MEALTGAGEMHLSGANTQGVIQAIIHFLDNCGETSTVRCCHRYPHASTLVRWLSPLPVNTPLLPLLYMLLLLLVNILLVTAALMSGLNLCQEFCLFCR